MRTAAATRSQDVLRLLAVAGVIASAAAFSTTGVEALERAAKAALTDSRFTKLMDALEQGYGAGPEDKAGAGGWCCADCNCQDRTNDEEACTGALSQTTCADGEGTPQPTHGGGAVKPSPSCTASSCTFYYLCDESSDYTRPDEQFTHCGQVDAAPSIPKALFQPANADKLALYIAFTKAIQPQDPFCRTRYPDFGSIKLGTCASAGYEHEHANEPGREITWGGYPHGRNPDFGPSTDFVKACVDGCGCCPEPGLLYHPGAVPECPAVGRPSLPYCHNGFNKYQPHAPALRHEWCGVCGPTMNAPHFVDFYFASAVPNVCDPRDAADPSPICAAATGRSACLAHPLKCAWRAPTPSGTCGVKGCCSIFGSGPTCDWDCASCRKASVSGVRQEDFAVCCDKCEFCSASGNGALATEATCGQPQDGRVHCEWSAKNGSGASS